MRLVHLSDLHIGKKVNGFSMLEDQEYIFMKILGIINEQKPVAVMIAGDIYDKSIPSEEAVRLFDWFLVELSKGGIKVFVISGNHDSAERIGFGNKLMSISGVHMSPAYNNDIKPVKLNDEFGELNMYMLPFVKPYNVRNVIDDIEINSYTDAVRVAVDEMNIDTKARNIIITHQFVTGAECSDSECASVGGTDNISRSIFENFDYVALGHIHKPQSMNSANTIRYCGSPLKYSFSETKEKSVTIIDIKEKGDINISLVPLAPKRDMYEIRGTYNEVMSEKISETSVVEDYVHIILTDEEEIPNVMNKLRAKYRNVMKLDYDNKRTQSNNLLFLNKNIEGKRPIELFAEFYEMQNNTTLSDKEEEYLNELMSHIWEE